MSVGLVVNDSELEKSADPTVLSWFCTWILLPANPIGQSGLDGFG